MSGIWFPVEKHELSTWRTKIYFSLSAKGGKWEFKCCIHDLKSAVTLINSYSEILIHLSPTRYKVTDISICVLTLFYFSVQLHGCRTLCPPSVYLFFMLSLTAITLCLVLTAPGDWDQGWRKHVQRAGKQQWQKGKLCLDIREACICLLP